MAWNVFKFCTALRGLGSIMILLVLGVVGVTYYAVVLTSYGPALYDGGLKCLTALAVLISFHSLLVMLLWSYFSVVFTDPGSVPSNWRPQMDEERGEADPLTIPEYSGVPAEPSHPKIRFCKKCNQLKPPRCHHCSVCGKCVLKMDHHCVWVVNCVGALNYKYFLLFLVLSCESIFASDMSNTNMSSDVVDIDTLSTDTTTNIFIQCLSTLVAVLDDVGRDLQLLPFLFFCSWALIDTLHGFLPRVFYTFLETSLVTICLLPQFIAFFTDGEIPGAPSTLATTFLAFVLNLAFALSVLGFLIMHISLVAANTTTIEAYEKTTPKWRYDLGRKKNFQQVFGTDKRFWFIPAYSDEDLRRMPELQGLDYPSKPDLDAQ